jgi:flagellin
MERLSSGMRINYAKDDAAGQAIATRLTAEVQGLEMASRNASDAQALIDTAEGALQESHNLLLRMRELAVQSANGTMSSDDLDATDAEYQQMIAELDRVSDTTAWAGTKLLDGTNSTLTFQVGADGTSDHRISMSLSNMDSASLGLGSHGRGPDNVADTQFNDAGESLDANGDVNQDDDGNNILLGDDASMDASDLQTQANAQDALARIDAAIKMVSTTRATFGAASNRLSSTITNLDQITVNLDASKGRIQDADFAAETSNLAKSQILQQAATAMLAQANASKQTVLALVR